MCVEGVCWVAGSVPAAGLCFIRQQALTLLTFCTHTPSHPQVLHFDTLRVKEAEFARKVQAAVRVSVAKGAAGNLAGEKQPTKDTP